MSAPYQALIRQSDLLNPSSLIVTNEPNQCTDWNHWVTQNNGKILSWVKSVVEDYPEQHTQFALPNPDNIVADHAVLIWPKSKDLALCLLQCLATHFSQVIVVGANDTGGKSIAKAAANLITNSEKVASINRCSIWRLNLKPQANFNWLHFAKSFTWDKQSYIAVNGVFSCGRLDTGTELLLEYLPAPEQGSLLDLGCGCGVIGLTFKQRNQKLSVTLADVDLLATYSSELNAMRLGHDVNIVAENGLEDINDTFDFIVCNPPFHQGKNTDYHFSQRLFSNARQRLRPNGQLWIVANRHLPYEDWAQQYFNNVEIMAQEKGFKLLLAVNND